MNLKPAIAVFVKTPGLSPIKTRLAAAIGQEKALEFYQLTLTCVQETLETLDVTPYWAVGEEEGLTHPRWQNFERVYTKLGDLGARQHHVYSALRQKHDRVMLMSADSPQLPTYYLANILEHLDTHDYAASPAHDGGYNCLAGKKDITGDIWSSVEYSQDTTYQDLCSKLQGNIFTAKPYTDVDHAQDLKTILNEMPDNMTPAQTKLCEWIKSID